MNGGHEPHLVFNPRFSSGGRLCLAGPKLPQNGGHPPLQGSQRRSWLKLSSRSSRDSA